MELAVHNQVRWWAGGKGRHGVCVTGVQVTFFVQRFGGPDYFGGMMKESTWIRDMHKAALGAVGFVAS